MINIRKSICCVTLIAVANSVSSNPILSSIENNHNFNSPIGTVEKIINAKGNVQLIDKFLSNKKYFSSEAYKLINNSTAVDFSSMKQYRACTYRASNNEVFTIEYKKVNKTWQLIKLPNNPVSSLVSKNIYKEREEKNCFPSFMNHWEKLNNGKKLLLIKESARVSNVLVASQNEKYSATFNFQYKHPTQSNYKNGWLVDSAFISSTNTKISQSSLPSVERSYSVDELLNQTETLSAQSNKINYPTILEMTCHHKEHERKVRLKFVLKQKKNIQSSILQQSTPNKTVAFGVKGGDTAVYNLNNCSRFLETHYEGEVLSISLRNFNRQIEGVIHGSGQNQTISFIDYLYK